MGILRTDKISGLETPTAVTGSVLFDGTNDYISVGNSSDYDMGGDFTAEVWVYPTAFTNDYAGIFGFSHDGDQHGWNILHRSSSGRLHINVDMNYLDVTNSLQLNKWTHLALVRSGSGSGNCKLYIDGVADPTTITETDPTGTPSSAQCMIGTYPGMESSREFTGYISNARVLNGTALYTSNFTPPVHELEVIGDTVLLCCNNPDSAAADGTGKTITVNGDAAASTFSPGLTRDFTFGTEFKGVTTFDTQGYFVPPSGTTEQRGRGRGIFGGAYLTPQGANASIEYIETSSSGNGLDFGDMSSTAMMSTALANSTRSVFAGGYSGGTINTIEFVTTATTSNTTNFGDLSESKRHMAACASNTKGVWAGGTTTGSTNATTTLDNVTIQSLGNAVDYGDLSAARRSHGGASSPTRGVFAGGNTNTPTPNLGMQTIDYFTIASGGTALSFGSLTVGTREIGGSSDSTRAVFGGGYQVPANSYTNTIEFVTIATTGNAQDFGDLTVARSFANGLSNSVKGVFGGGAISPVYSNTIDYVTIQSTGNANDFGDLIQQRLGYANTACDSHGGIS
jgi:hypothetical protein